MSRMIRGQRCSQSDARHSDIHEPIVTSQLDSAGQQEMSC